MAIQSPGVCRVASCVSLPDVPCDDDVPPAFQLLVTIAYPDSGSSSYGPADSLIFMCEDV